MEVYGTSAETVLVLERSLRDTMGNDAPDATAIIAVLFYLRVGHWELAHLAWAGWQALGGAKIRWRTPRVYADEVVQTLRAIAPKLADGFLDPEGGWLAPAFRHEANDTQGIVPGCRLIADTVPCRTENIGNSNCLYISKYAGNVVKKLSFITLTGFFCEPLCVPRVLYTGTSTDGVLLEHSSVDDFLKKHSSVVLADGGFYLNEVTITPFTGPEIWPSDPPPNFKGEVFRVY
jgi:hypothetical protein